MVVKVRQKNPGWLKGLLTKYRKGPVLAVGWPQGTDAAGISYPDGTSVVMVAAVQNFGSATNGIPARPFMTEGQEPAIRQTEPIARALIPAVNAGKATMADVLKQMGPFASAAFQKAITDGAFVALKSDTIARKGSDRPLIDTGLMRNSLTWVVRPK